MFRAFDEDNTRAFAGHALDCRNYIRINLKMARSYHIALSESIGFGEGRENDPAVMAVMLQPSAWIENVRRIFMFGDKYQPVAAVVDAVPGARFCKVSLAICITE